MWKAVAQTPAFPSLIQPAIHPLTVSLAYLGTTFFFFFYCAIYKYFKDRSGSRRRSQTQTKETHDDFIDEDHCPILDHLIWYILTVGLQPSIISSITICKYKRGDGLVEGTECSVCLNHPPIAPCAVPVKSQPLHDFSLAFLKWDQKNQMNLPLTELPFAAPWRRLCDRPTQRKTICQDHLDQIICATGRRRGIIEDLYLAIGIFEEAIFDVVHKAAHCLLSPFDTSKTLLRWCYFHSSGTQDIPASSSDASASTAILGDNKSNAYTKELQFPSVQNTGTHMKPFKALPL
ncbi:hypothetical protein F0562_019473 [Nyssa sinensis]|uniref:Uncharacterized protein n=1 Tax=Nyssa sinensis TaxID=561372 RepID=A0A5J5BRJ5_9ASTE|nr:hypothetical protein F0562_019473 [Nyssa sinensis]